MELQEAEQLLKLLCDGFRIELQEGAYRTYLGAFEELARADLAYETVKTIIYNGDRFPSIATIRSTYKQKRDLQLDRDQNQLEAERDTVRELPSFVKEFVAKLEGTAKPDEPAAPSQVLVEAGPGRCDDCHNEVSTRYLYGKFSLCTMCSGSRLRVAAKL